MSEVQPRIPLQQLGGDSSLTHRIARQHSGRDAVRIAHMEIAEPSILAAVSSFAQEGFTDIIIAPYFLSPGRHISQDIPRLMVEAQQAHPGTTLKLAAPIGDLLLLSR